MRAKTILFLLVFSVVGTLSWSSVQKKSGGVRIGIGIPIGIGVGPAYPPPPYYYGYPYGYPYGYYPRPVYYVQPAPVYMTPPPTYVQGAPVYQQPAPAPQQYYYTPSSSASTPTYPAATSPPSLPPPPPAQPAGAAGAASASLLRPYLLKIQERLDGRMAALVGADDVDRRLVLEGTFLDAPAAARATVGIDHRLADDVGPLLLAVVDLDLHVDQANGLVGKRAGLDAGAAVPAVGIGDAARMVQDGDADLDLVLLLHGQAGRSRRWDRRGRRACSRIRTGPGAARPAASIALPARPRSRPVAGSRWGRSSCTCRRPCSGRGTPARPASPADGSSPRCPSGRGTAEWRGAGPARRHARMRAHGGRRRRAGNRAANGWPALRGCRRSVRSATARQSGSGGCPWDKTRCS